MSVDVGTHLKAVRQMYGLSQRELAKRAGVTNGLISLIEQNRVSPSVSSLKKVLDGVPMELAEFFTLDLAGKPPVYFAKAELADVGLPNVRRWLVGQRHSKRAITILLQQYEPGAASEEETSSVSGEIGGVVVRGRIELVVGGQSRELEAGDAFYFSSALPHRFRNTGREVCELVSASVPATI
jgi:transcriptional regulator with XRE-family HTH domain